MIDRNIKLLKQIRSWYDDNLPRVDFPIDQVKQAIAYGIATQKRDRDAFGKGESDER